MSNEIIVNVPGSVAVSTATTADTATCTAFAIIFDDTDPVLLMTVKFTDNLDRVTKTEQWEITAPDSSAYLALTAPVGDYLNAIESMVRDIMDDVINGTPPAALVVRAGSLTIQRPT